jgi:two-component system, LytTR family, response regulator
MDILIIEDEPAASNRLKKMLAKIDPDTHVLAVIEGVEDAVNWFKNNAEPDLVMMDIQLSDGKCFDIFEHVTVECPMIFTTAYDEYAVDAFKQNSIDYLLKPVDQGALESSINKFKKLKKRFSSENQAAMEAVLKGLVTSQPAYKSRFLVKSGASFHSIVAEDICYFVIETQLVFMVTRKEKKFMLDSTLDELESILDPDAFFRINRQMIVALDAIKTLHPYFNSRLKLDLFPPYHEDVLVSRNKVPGFKKWLDR